jgi:hypothetical protein
MSLLSQWIRDNKDNLGTIVPLVGTAITAAVLILTFYGTSRLTKSLRKSHLAVQFGDDFNKLMEMKHKIKTGQVTTPPTWNEQRDGKFLQVEAYHYYAQFFGFQFSEFHAYQAGYIDRDVFTVWMKSRPREFRNESLQNVSYEAGWRGWLVERNRNVRDNFTHFMEDIHRCDTDEDVERVVGEYGPWSARLRAWLRRPCRLQCALTVFALAAVAVATILWLR